MEFDGREGIDVELVVNNVVQHVHLSSLFLNFSFCGCKVKKTSKQLKKLFQGIFTAGKKFSITQDQLK
jgi:hypothetical protein